MLQVSQKAPEFTADAVINGDFATVNLNDYQGKWVVLFFYPLDFTFVCPTEITAFSDNYAKFQALNTEIIGVSVDSKFSHLAWINTPRNQGGLGEINYPLVSDLNKQISADYNVLIEGAGVALRGLFLIDPEGTVVHQTVNALNVGRSVNETLRVVKAFQMSAETGDVCPANWDEGADLMHGDVQGSQEWFQKHG
ncbi:peroxiredoxin [Myxococcota bacterium]|nr:peroxiredoxin [Myxococcota bacterium]MBU1432216.1 peroxiredoxin [Myxococcota bacterium]MBU1900413.1 peroxiredoxin [Myxococcota bacterium]